MNKPSLEEIDDIRRQGFRPQVVGCFINNEKILFVFSEEHNLWQLPQGGIDNGETIDDAFSREMAEELGEPFVDSAQGSLLVIGDDQLVFPSSKHGSRELKLDNGKEVLMTGKRYFFTVANTDATEIDMQLSEFDDYKWVSFAKAMALADKMYQKGKQKITSDALEKMKESRLIA